MWNRRQQDNVYTAALDSIADLKAANAKLMADLAHYKSICERDDAMEQAERVRSGA